MDRNYRIVLSAIGLVLVLAVATAARAEHTCMLNGQSYPENAVVCSGGLALVCSNGAWQDSHGARCDAPTGSYLGPRRPFQERNAEPVPDFYKEKYPELNLQ
jgi:hypothetical protein